MGRLGKWMGCAVAVAVPLAIVAGGWTNEADAIAVVISEFDPSVQIVDCPTSVKRGEAFTIRGFAFPVAASPSTEIFIAVAQERRDGKPQQRRSTAVFTAVDDSAPVPFEVTTRASGWSSGTIHVGASIVSHDVVELGGASAAAVETCEIAVTTGKQK